MLKQDRHVPAQERARAVKRFLKICWKGKRFIIFRAHRRGCAASRIRSRGNLEQHNSGNRQGAKESKTGNKTKKEPRNDQMTFSIYSGFLASLR